MLNFRYLRFDVEKPLIYQRKSTYLRNFSRAYLSQNKDCSSYKKAEEKPKQKTFSESLKGS